MKEMKKMAETVEGLTVIFGSGVHPDYRDPESDGGTTYDSTRALIERSLLLAETVYDCNGVRHASGVDVEQHIAALRAWLEKV
jgi:hypothetical protein